MSSYKTELKRKRSVYTFTFKRSLIRITLNLLQAHCISRIKIYFIFYFHLPHWQQPTVLNLIKRYVSSAGSISPRHKKLQNLYTKQAFCRWHTSIHKPQKYKLPLLPEQIPKRSPEKHILNGCNS